MIPYHGLPVTPEEVAEIVLKSGHGFVSHRHRSQLPMAALLCQSFAVDNGAFSAWAEGNPITDWSPYYSWAADCAKIPNCDFAVIPDIIDGDEKANDALLADWPLPRWFGAPVWHLHESFERLYRLATSWPRICLGSSGEFNRVGSPQWTMRMALAMTVLCDVHGRPITKIHGLRMLNPKVFTRYPLSSADSTNIARNVGIDVHWKSGNYLPATKRGRAAVMRDRIEIHNSPSTWTWSTN